MGWKGCIVATADTCAGKPRIKGTWITVERVPDCLVSGWNEAQIIQAYPPVSTPQIHFPVAFASSWVSRDWALSAIEAAA